MLTREEREEFLQNGIVRMPGAISPSDARAMRDRVWDALEKKFNLRRDAAETWPATRLTGAHALPAAETFDEIGSPAVRDALDKLLGHDNWSAPERWGSLLVAFPESNGRWDVPHQSWHLDLPASHALDELFAMRLFTCLEQLRHGGGATVVVAGSHRLVQKLVRRDGIEKMRSADARKSLIRTYPWMRDLCSHDDDVDRQDRFMKHAATIDDVEVRVIEMTGEPGDVFLVHPLMLHAPSANCAAAPRLVLSSMVYRAGVTPGAMYH